MLAFILKNANMGYSSMIDKLLILIGIMGILCLAGWSFLALPELEHTTDTFEISAENIGEIRLSDTVGVPLSDPIKMVFGWTQM
jgi:hypothetical protein